MRPQKTLGWLSFKWSLFSFTHNCYSVKEVVKEKALLITCVISSVYKIISEKRVKTSCIIGSINTFTIEVSLSAIKCEKSRLFTQVSNKVISVENIFMSLLLVTSDRLFNITRKNPQHDLCIGANCEALLYT